MKTFVISKLMFHASLISLTKDIIKQVDSTIYEFISKVKDKIKRLALISEKWWFQNASHSENDRHVTYYVPFEIC